MSRLRCCSRRPGLPIASVAPTNAFVLLGLVLAVVGINAAYGPFYTLPSTFLAGPAAAGGIALIYSIGNLGGFAGPMIIGVSIEGDRQLLRRDDRVQFLPGDVAATIVLLLGRTRRIRTALTARSPSATDAHERSFDVARRVPSGTSTPRAARRASGDAGQGACSMYQPRCLRKIFSPSASP